MKMPRASLWIMPQIARPAPEQHPPPVWRRPEIEEQPFGVGDHPVRREQFGDPRRAKFLGRDLI